jgi:hypothetical protein
MTIRFPARLVVVLGAALTWLAAPALAQEKLTSAQSEFFEKKIRPAFVKYCYECHSIETGKTRGGLLVDTREGLLQGGDSGPAIAPKNLDESMLWGAITYDTFQMPPEKKMPAEVIADFKTWIEMGAPDPRIREKLFVASKIDIEAGKEHWAFQKPQRPARAGIDLFVSGKLLEAKLNPVEAADPATLLRRLNFDLIGLPPSPDEVNAFLAAWKQSSRTAISKKVDELLARPQFGERWGRHWLDVARYAESSGKSVNVTYPHAWRYRNFVFDSFNEDKPYDEFIRQQIAGDLLAVKTDEEWQENLIATAFLAMGTKGLNERNPRQFRMDVVDEQIDTMSQAVLGLTVGCARCHDHKFDPIPTTDYYALAGIFLSTKTYYGTVSGLQNQRPAKLLILPIADEESATRGFSPEEIEQMEERIQEIQSTIRQARIEQRRGGKGLQQQQFLRMRNQIDQIQGQLDTLDENGQPRTYAMGVQDLDETVQASVLVRGDVEKSAQQVDRGFLQVLDFGDEIKSNRSGRKELADWLTSKDNPLTARVMVNRIWMHLLGEPLMGSPNNWGTTGQKPTHPQLLDYLSVRFMDQGWSVKSVIREIVLSKTYQRGSTYSRRNYEVDPDNRLLWRANPRQLDAESLRDSVLALSGHLNLDRPFASEIAAEGDKRIGRQFDGSTAGDNSKHRSVYLPILRDSLPEALALFDFADPNASAEKRTSTNVPSQSLFLMNNSFVLEQARGMAAKLSEKFTSPEQQVEHAFLLAYGRPATDDEILASLEFYERFLPEARRNFFANRTSVTQPRGPAAGQRSVGQPGRRPFGQFPRGGRRPGGGPPQPPLNPAQQTLMAFCQGLMASAEFRILN